MADRIVALLGIVLSISGLSSAYADPDSPQAACVIRNTLLRLWERYVSGGLTDELTGAAYFELQERYLSLNALDRSQLESVITEIRQGLTGLSIRNRSLYTLSLDAWIREVAGSRQNITQVQSQFREQLRLFRAAQSEMAALNPFVNFASDHGPEAVEAFQAMYLSRPIVGDRIHVVHSRVLEHLGAMAETGARTTWNISNYYFATELRDYFDRIRRILSLESLQTQELGRVLSVLETSASGEEFSSRYYLLIDVLAARGWIGDEFGRYFDQLTDISQGVIGISSALEDRMGTNQAWRIEKFASELAASGGGIEPDINARIRGDSRRRIPEIVWRKAELVNAAMSDRSNWRLFFEWIAPRTMQRMAAQMNDAAVRNARPADAAIRERRAERLRVRLETYRRGRFDLEAYTTALLDGAEELGFSRTYSIIPRNQGLVSFENFRATIARSRRGPQARIHPLTYDQPLGREDLPHDSEIRRAHGQVPHATQMLFLYWLEQRARLPQGTVSSLLHFILTASDVDACGELWAFLFDATSRNAHSPTELTWVMSRNLGRVY